MATIVKRAIRTSAGWIANQAEMETLYGVDGYYTLLSVWEDDITLDLVSANEQWVLECYNDHPTGLDDSIDFGIYTSNTTYNIIVRGAESAGTEGPSIFTGDITEGFRIKSEADQILAMDNTIDIIIQNIIIEAISGYCVFIANLDDINIHIEKCCLIGYDIPGWPAINMGRSNTFINNLILNHWRGIAGGNELAYVYGNVIIECGTGMDWNSPSGYSEVYNNIILNSDGLDMDITTNINQGNNATSDTTGQITGITSAEFIDAASDNYHLANGSQLIGAGLNLIQSANLISPQYDIDGDQLPDTGPWDVGFDYKLPDTVKKSLRSVTGWVLNQAEMEALYGVDGYYTLLNVWEDDLPANLVTVNEQWILECYNDWSAGNTSNASFNEQITSTTTNIIVRGAELNGIEGPSKFTGNTIEGVLFNAPLNVNVFDDPPRYTEIYNIRFFLFNERKVIFSYKDPDVTFRDNYVRGLDTEITALAVIYAYSTAINYIVYNNLIINIGDAALTVYSADMYVYNNTFIDCNLNNVPTLGGISINGTTANTAEVHNNIILDSGTKDIYLINQADPTMYSNATSDTTGQITGVTTSEFIDAAGGDYRLANGSQLINAGRNLIENGELTSPQYDVTGYQLPDTGPWDVGFYYTIASIVKYAIRTSTGWSANQAEMEALYGVNGYYTLLSVWEDDLPTNLVTVKEKYILECYNDWSPDLVDGVYFDITTTDFERTVIITGAELDGTEGPSRFTGDITEGFFLRSLSVSFSTPPDYAIIQNMRMKASNNCIQAYDPIKYVTMQNNFITSNNDYGGAGIVFSQSYSNNCIIRNNLIKKVGTGISVYDENYVYNNICVDNNYGYYIGDTSIAYNNIGINNINTDISFSGSATLLNNATSDTTGQITGITSTEFVDYDNDDYHLANSSQLNRAGRNLIENGELPSPQYDIDDNLYPDTGYWDIGFDYNTNYLQSIALDDNYPVIAGITLNGYVLTNDTYYCA